jgi:hypothetical protein
LIEKQNANGSQQLAAICSARLTEMLDLLKCMRFAAIARDLNYKISECTVQMTAV